MVDVNQDFYQENRRSYFYGRQFENLMKQCIRIFSNFSYKTGINYDTSEPGQLLPIPCKYGDASRMVSQIMKNNSENTAISAPMFAVYISDVDIAAYRRAAPTHESSLQFTERAIDPETNRYTAEQGNQYRVDRLAPIPYDVKLQVDYLFTNVSQQWQALEQILMIFNPMIDLQTNENPADWTNPFTMELVGIRYNSRSVPAGNDDSINVATFSFKICWWLNPPAKVKRLFFIKNVIANIGPDDPSQTVDVWTAGDFSQVITSAQDHKINVSGNQAILLGKFGATTDDQGDVFSWEDILKKFGNYNPVNTIMRLRPGANIAYTASDIIANFTVDQSAANTLNLTFRQDTLPLPTIPGVTNIIDPRSLFPGNGITPATGQRYLILYQIPANTVAWGSFSAPINSIIEYNGSAWQIVFVPNEAEEGTIVENRFNGKLYVLVMDGWVSVIEGTYSAGYWTIEYFTDQVPVTDKAEL